MENNKKSIYLLIKQKILIDIDAGLEYSLIAAKYDLNSPNSVAIIKKNLANTEKAIKGCNLSPLRKTLI